MNTVSRRLYETFYYCLIFYRINHCNCNQRISKNFNSSWSCSWRAFYYRWRLLHFNNN